ncbi:MAG: RnfABCDGE type electron transport complex subunit B [Gammaproteobacteria bacterium]|nr:RnfABCDGE type electron transport complex subunit B [Gammaproteobacteria bacterium]
MKPVSVKGINALLPQTQCGECGYEGCLPYAQAIHAKLATINHCPPGGVKTLTALGEYLNIDIAPYVNEKQDNTRPPQLASINEPLCIGCTKCIQACPVDAIIGSEKQMHVIITHECTGCGLCVEPCPVDCIEMHETPVALFDPVLAQTRFEAKKQRSHKEKQKKEVRYQQKRQLSAETDIHKTEQQAKNHYILAALARVKQKHE